MPVRGKMFAKSLVNGAHFTWPNSRHVVHLSMSVRCWTKAGKHPHQIERIGKHKTSGEQSCVSARKLLIK
jgi:hypothetical protein